MKHGFSSKGQITSHKRVLIHEILKSHGFLCDFELFVALLIFAVTFLQFSKFSTILYVFFVITRKVNYQNQ